MKQKTASESNDFANYVLDLLAPLGPCTARKMFGGYGVHHDGVNIAIIAFEQLWLKVDTETEPAFAAAGCKPFIYEGKGKPIQMSYWTVPAEAMESPAEMLPWARRALAAALRAAAAKKPAAKKQKAPAKKVVAKKPIAKKATARTPVAKKTAARKTKAAKKAVTKKASKRI